MRSKVRPNGKVYSIDELAEMIAPVARELGVERIYLFGSYARGEATPDSDVDILIDSGEIEAISVSEGSTAGSTVHWRRI